MKFYSFDVFTEKFELSDFINFENVINKWSENFEIVKIEIDVIEFYYATQRGHNILIAFSVFDN